MGYHECLCRRTPCICGSDRQPVRMRFTPESFSMLVDREVVWFEFLMRLTRRRTDDPEHIWSDIITLMLRDRARQLRN